jgi:hypothetical protein
MGNISKGVSPLEKNVKTILRQKKAQNANILLNLSYSKIVRASKNLNSVKITLSFLTAEALYAGAEVGESAGGAL